MRPPLPRRSGEQLALLATLTLVVLAIAPAATVRAAERYVPGQVVVRYRADVSTQGRAAVRARVGAHLGRTLHVPGFEIDTIARDRSVPAAVAAFKRQAEVASAQPNYLYSPTSACPIPATNGLCIPNDPRWTLQYGFNNRGGTISGQAGIADADIDAPEAWDITQGSTNVTVAIVDTGVDYHQPDLAPLIWTNPGETGLDANGHDKRTNGIDDDHNGYVDDWHGWNVVGNSVTSTTDSNNDPMDLRAHGTHVAGIVGATGNNAFAVTGVNWRVKLMPVRVQGPKSLMTMADVAEGFEYAADNGARIVNASISGSESSQVLRDVVDRHPNTLYVVAANNRTRNVDLAGNQQYPCMIPSANLICVAATDNRDALAYFSNWGPTSVDLAAPGHAIISLQPPFRTVYSEAFGSDPFASARWVEGSSAGPAAAWALSTTDAGSTPYSITDSPGAPYPGHSDRWFRSASAINLAGQKGCTLSSDISADTAAGDGVYVQARRDTSFTAPTNAFDADRPDDFGDMLGFYSGTWTHSFRRGDLSELDGGPVYLRFGLLATTANTAGKDGGYIDDIRVYCLDPSYTYSTNGLTELSYESGTSMSTPMVSGVAALLLAKWPSLTTAQLRDKLLRSVDKKSSLAGKVVTGGRLNAYKALAESHVAVENGVLHFTAESGERNNVTVARFTDTDGQLKYRVRDLYSTSTSTPQTGSRIVPGAGCVQGASDPEAICSGAITSVRVETGDMDDSISLVGTPVPGTLDGGPGNDTLTGGSGADTFIGGPGNDTINAVDGVKDKSFDCGEDGTSPGTDRDVVTADAIDPVSANASNCEVVSGGGGTPGPVAPTAATGSASSVTSSGATLNGTVNPQGQATTYWFDYGPTTGHEFSTTKTSAGSGTSAVAVTATIGGLTAGTLYHVHLMASNATGTTDGGGVDFTTTPAAAAPTAATGSASSVTSSGATLNGTVNPRGQATTYWFDYGPTTGHEVSTTKTSAGSGTAAIPVTATIGGLAAGTLYHVHLMASNAAGTTDGGAQDFTTASSPPPTSGYAATVQADRPVSYWRLGELSGTVARDVMNTNPATYSGGVTLGAPGAIGDDTAALFNGSTTLVTAPNSASLNTGDTFSIEAWVKPSRLGAVEGIATKQGSWMVYLDAANRLMLYQPNIGSIATASKAISDTTSWHHVVVTKAGSSVHLYLDGADVTGTVTNRTLANTTANFFIGAGASRFAGGIDEVALYNVALSPTAVTTHFLAR